MKKTVILCLLLSSFGWAQPNATTNATAAPQRKLTTIFDYQKELKLTPEQIEKMKAALGELRTVAQQQQGRLAKMEQEYRELIKTDVPIETARAKLQEIAKVQVDLRIFDLQISRRITGALSPDQLKAWRELQAKRAKQS